MEMNDKKLPILPEFTLNAELKHVNHIQTYLSLSELYALCFHSVTNTLPLSLFITEKERAIRREREGAILLNGGKHV